MSKKDEKQKDTGHGLSIQQVDVDNCVPSPHQARSPYPQHKLKELENSIRVDGVIQPIIPRQAGDHYEVCAGWGRVLASRMAGKEKIPAIIRDLSEQQMAKLGIMENLQRQDLNVVERARAYKILQEICHMTQEQIAKEMGTTRDIVAQTLRILNFPEAVQNLLVQDIVTPSHAESLARLAGAPDLLKEAIDRVTRGKMSSSQTEQLVAELLARSKLRKNIAEFVNGEDFVLTLHYKLFPWERLQICPLCIEGKVEFDEKEGVWTCPVCHWNSDDADEKWVDLTIRARLYALRKKGIKTSFTQYWEGQELP